MASPTHNTPALRIVSVKEGFRRAGVSHGKNPKDWPAGHFSPAQVEQLKAEKMLTVIEIPATDESKAKPEGGAGDDKATLEEVVAAIKSLDPANAELWTKGSGDNRKPQVQAVAAVLGGKQVNNKQRDGAWAIICKDNS